MDQRFAIIDLGTNTFHLLVAQKGDKKPGILHREKVGVKLGKSGINEDIIQDEALDRAITALQSFKKTIDTFNVTSLHAYGTSALRNATNSREITDRIKSSTGINVTILSGAEEAEMIYRGVRSALDLGDEVSLIVDIGAGSVEFILADRTRAWWSKSIEIGAQRILEKFSISDPITAGELEQINLFFDTSFREVDEGVKKFPPQTLVGSSGSFDTLSDMYCREKNIPISDSDSETPLTIDFVNAAHKQIIQTTRAQRMKLPGMIELRVDLIVIGSCMVRYILKKYKISQIRVSRYSLKEGALAMLSK